REELLAAEFERAPRALVGEVLLHEVDGVLALDAQEARVCGAEAAEFEHEVAALVLRPRHFEALSDGAEVRLLGLVAFLFLDVFEELDRSEELANLAVVRLVRDRLLELPESAVLHEDDL